MSSENFLLGIALEALGTGIPTDDVAPWIQHVNGIIGNGINEQPVSFIVTGQAI
jgi:hypothetical protein